MQTDLESQLRERQSEAGYLFPDYEGYCFGNVADTVRSILGVDAGRPLPGDVLSGLEAEYDRVLLVLVDGFGLPFWKRHDHPLLERLEGRGTVSPLTSTFPSETAAALTTLHTGRLPAAHGLLGWDVYDPADDASYEAFVPETKAGADVAYELQDVFEGDPIYPALTAAGIDCRHVVPFPETYDGATCHSYEHDLEAFAPTLEAAFSAADDPATLFAYLPQIDAAGHRHGTRSDGFHETVGEVFDALEAALSGLEDESADETLVLVTADHGLVDTDPDRNVDLERYETVMDGLERYGNGEPVRYAGSPRNVHLHLKEDRVDEVRALLEDELDARVFTRGDAIERNLFGDRGDSERFRRRVGDLVVVHRELSVWYGSDRDGLELIGMHGGLHPDEMLVPFAAATLETLRG